MLPRAGAFGGLFILLLSPLALRLSRHSYLTVPRVHRLLQYVGDLLRRFCDVLDALPRWILHPDHEQTALGVGEGGDVPRELLLGTHGEGTSFPKRDALLVVHRRSLADAPSSECSHVGACAQLVEELDHGNFCSTTSTVAKMQPIR